MGIGKEQQNKDARAGRGAGPDTPRQEIFRKGSERCPDALKKMLVRCRDALERYRQQDRRKTRKRFAAYEWLGAGVSDIPKILEAADRVFRKRVRILAAATVLLFAGAWLCVGMGAPDLPSHLVRPPAGSPASDAVLELQLESGDASASGTVDLKISPQELSPEQAEELFARCRDELAEIILPEGSDAEHIRSDLFLPAEHLGMALSWHSLSQGLSDLGEVDMIDVQPGEPLELICLMSLDGCSSECRFELHADPQTADRKPSLIRRARELRDLLSEDGQGESLQLPTEYRGALLSWRLPRQPAPVWILCLGAFAALYLYFGRYDAGEKRLKALSRDLSAELPSVSMQLILLLDSGLVTEKALDELDRMNRNKDTVFFRAYRQICRQSRDLNRPAEQLLYGFARSSGDRDLIRFAAMIHDNTSHGSELAEKLEKERQQLRSSRMNSAKARIKEAETALCLPLMLLMLSLIAVSAAPALLEMQ